MLLHVIIGIFLIKHLLYVWKLNKVGKFLKLNHDYFSIKLFVYPELVSVHKKHSSSVTNNIVHKFWHWLLTQVDGAGSFNHKHTKLLPTIMGKSLGTNSDLWRFFTRAKQTVTREFNYTCLAPACPASRSYAKKVAEQLVHVDSPIWTNIFCFFWSSRLRFHVFC